MDGGTIAETPVQNPLRRALRSRDEDHVLSFDVPPRDPLVSSVMLADVLAGGPLTSSQPLDDVRRFGYY